MIDARSHHPIQNRWRSEMPISAPGPLPTVVEQSGRGDRAFDIYSRLLRASGSFSWAPALMTQSPMHW